MFPLPIQKRLQRQAIILLVLISTGTIGYSLIEKWPIFDSLYMTITTLTTVGYGETHPLGFSGRLFTIFLIFAGVGTLLYILSDTAQLIAETDPRELFGRKKMKDKITKLSKHQIVCGFGRTGQEVASEFKNKSVPFVIIEQDSLLYQKAIDEGFLAINGDATEDAILKDAQIEKATGIICTLPDDAANTFITLSAKVFNEKITIVCRAANPGSESKMSRAGAHTVISPYVIAGRRMAVAVTNPLVLEFLDVAMHNPAFDLRMEQIVISLHSKLVGMTLRDANIKQTAGPMVLAVGKGNELLTNPSPDLKFQTGDILIALGADEELDKLSILAGQSLKN